MAIYNQEAEIGLITANDHRSHEQEILSDFSKAYLSKWIFVKQKEMYVPLRPSEYLLIEDK